MQETNQSARRSSWLQRRWRIILPILLAFIIILGAVLYTQLHTISTPPSNSRAANIKPGQALPQQPQGLVQLQLPPGFQANIFFSGLQEPRFITFSPDGVLFVAERGTGSVVALPAAGKTGQASKKQVVISGLNDPTSLVFYQGALYVGEASQVSRFTLGPNLQVTSRSVIVPNLPTGGNHVTRTVLIGPDGRLYVSIGSTCNVCVESDPHRAAVWVYNLDGSNGHLYSRGLRNAVGLAINPWNQQIWVTDNGRDLMGDDTPPETVYTLQANANYGWPTCQAGDIIDPDYGHSGSCNGVVQPLIKMQAHSAPLGLAFYNVGTFPAQYHGLFVAFHGSWNRTVPTGYKVVFIPLTAQGQVNGPARDFAAGWLHNTNASGRPVGLAIGPDGALYVSDDAGGKIYRIAYQP